MTECERGHHGPILERVIESATTVNVDHICTLCGVRVATVSWTRAAYETKHAAWDPGGIAGTPEAP